jgi:acetyl esterase
MNPWRRLCEAAVARTGPLVTLPVEVASSLARLLPSLNPADIAIRADITYGTEGSQALDVYVPAGPGPWPVVLYIHGGGFTAWSKDTYWLVGPIFAREGYLVVNIDYRKAPGAPFPAALEDASLAYVWLARHAEQLGADLGRLVLAGDSSGANLATGLALASCAPGHEPWVERVFATGVVPRALVCACAFLEVSDPLGRRAGQVSPAMARRIARMSEPYLSGSETLPPSWRRWADPLLMLEQGFAPTRPLPPIFAPVGSEDPIVSDTRRLKVALDRLGVPCDAPEYEGGIHGFHFLLFSERARRCWGDTFTFLARVLGGEHAVAA